MKSATNEPVDINMCEISQVAVETIMIVSIFGIVNKHCSLTHPEERALIELPSTRTVPLGDVCTLN